MFRTGNLDGEGGRQNNFFKPALSEVFIGKVTKIIMKFDLKNKYLEIQPTIATYWFKIK